MDLVLSLPGHYIIIIKRFNSKPLTKVCNGQLYEFLDYQIFKRDEWEPVFASKTFRIFRIIQSFLPWTLEHFHFEVIAVTFFLVSKCVFWSLLFENHSVFVNVFIIKVLVYERVEIMILWICVILNQIFRMFHMKMWF